MKATTTVTATVTTAGWFRAALTRALKTAGETATAMITTGAVIWELDWIKILGVTTTATLLSFIWSLRGLPEVVDANNDLT